jgi:hypothetical protein
VSEKGCRRVALLFVFCTTSHEKERIGCHCVFNTLNIYYVYVKTDLNRH